MIWPRCSLPLFKCDVEKAHTAYDVKRGIIHTVSHKTMKVQVILWYIHLFQILSIQTKKNRRLQPAPGFFLLFVPSCRCRSYTSFNEGIILLMTQKMTNGVAATVNAPNKPSR